MAQKDTAAQSPFDVRYHGQGERELLLHILHHLDHQEDHIRRLEAALARTEKAAGLIEGFAERVELPIQRTETAVGLITQAADRLEKATMALADQLGATGQKLDDFTTGLGGVIDTAVARIITEIQKQGQVPPEVQAAADHLSSVADTLNQMNAQNMERIVNAAPPAPVPPDGPIPDPVPTPVDPTPTPEGGARGARR